MVNPAEEIDRDRVGSRVSSGALVITGFNMMERLLGVMSIAVLGRLLSPEDFGVAAVAYVIIAIGAALENGQFRQALVRLRDPEPDHYATVFAMQLALGAALALATCALAAPAAALTRIDAVFEVVLVMALVPLFANLRNPYTAIFARRLEFVPGQMMGLIARVCSVCSAIGAAYAIGNHWAIVIGAVVFMAVRSGLTYVYMPIMPGFTFRHWRYFFGFGIWLSGSGIIDVLSRRADVLIVAARLETGVLGVYNLSKEVLNMAVSQFAGQFNQSLYPGLSAVAEDEERLRRGYRKSCAVMIGAMAPIGVGLALVADEFVYVLVGPQWGDLAPIIAALAPFSALSGVMAAIQSQAMVRGLTRSLFLIGLVATAAQIPAIYVGVETAGLMGAVYVRAAMAVLVSLLLLGLATRMTGAPFFAPVLYGARSLVSVAVMAAALTAVERALLIEPRAFLDHAVALFGKAGFGAATYIGVHALLWRLAGRPDGAETAVFALAGQGLARLRGLARGAA